MRMTKKAILVLVTVCTFLAPHKTHAKNKQIIKRITKKATSRIGAKYVYGASHTKRELRNKNQKRFDCSGFVSWVYYQSGHSIGVITSSRAKHIGKGVRRRNVRSGDILVFPHHVGVYVGHNSFVHAVNRRRGVRKDRLSGHWDRKILSIRRVIG